MFVKFNTTVGGHPREVYLNPAHVVGVVCNPDGRAPVLIRTTEGDISVPDMSAVQVVERLSGRGINLYEPGGPLPEASVSSPAKTPEASETLS
jgi:hypothetical protein